MTFDQWDVVIVPFPFSEQAGAKKRPALVLTKAKFNRAGHTVLAMITSAAHAGWPGDARITDLHPAGLKAPCIVRLKLFTLDNRVILYKIGRLAAGDSRPVAANLKEFLVGTPRAPEGANTATRTFLDRAESPAGVGEGDMVLNWSKWVPWSDLAKRARPEDAMDVPAKPGVYEVKRTDDEKRLTIGSSDNLRRRIIQGLVKGAIPHSSGERMRSREDLSSVVVRWAESHRYQEVETKLKEDHARRFGQLPKHTKR